jgi:hypothetical protein
MRHKISGKDLLWTLLSRLLSWFLWRHEAYRRRQTEELWFRREGLDLDLRRYK